MKLPLLITAFVIVVSISAKAQVEKSNGYSGLKTDVIELINIQNGNIREKFIAPALEKASRADAKKMETELNQTLDQFYTKAVEVYLKYYSQEEIQQILEFYKSDLGQKIMTVQPKISQKTMRLSQNLIRQLDPIMQKYLGR